MNKKAKILITVAILIVLLIIGVIVINKCYKKKATKLQQTNGITVVPTMRDIITADSRLNGNTNIKKFLLNTCNFKEYMVN